MRLVKTLQAFITLMISKEVISCKSSPDERIRPISTSTIATTTENYAEVTTEVPKNETNEEGPKSSWHMKMNQSEIKPNSLLVELVITKGLSENATEPSEKIEVFSKETSTEIMMETTTKNAPITIWDMQVNQTEMDSYLRNASVKEVCGRRPWLNVLNHQTIYAFGNQNEYSTLQNQNSSMSRKRRVVSGQDSNYGEWPWQLMIMKKNFLQEWIISCGAALLNEQWALTAAHCVEGYISNLDTTSSYKVQLGEYYRNLNNEPYPEMNRTIQSIIAHPKYVPSASIDPHNHDLALLKFSEPISFHPNSIPICLPDETELTKHYVGQDAFVSGWGRTNELYSSVPETLQEARLPILSNVDCMNWFNEANHSDHRFWYQKSGYAKKIPYEFVCAGYEDGQKDICFGDSGSPLVIQREDGRFILAGITSWTHGCGRKGSPAVFVRISQYADWIENTIKINAKWPLCINPLLINNGICDDKAYNSLDCDFDGNDCNSEQKNATLAREKHALWPNCDNPQKIDNGKCEGVNKNEECNFDGTDCSNWPNCKKPEYIDDNECDTETFSIECNFDGNDCRSTSMNSTKARQNHLLWPKCLQPQNINNGKCESINNNQECGYDGEDCTKQNKWKDCHNVEWIDDGVCDLSTFVPECNFDGSDCTSNHRNSTRARENAAKWPNCLTPQYINNGDCDTLNDIKDCDFDGNDCVNQKKWPLCPNAKLINNGVCEDENNIEECDFDGKDCVLKNKYSNCTFFDWINDGECDLINNNQECGYDGKDCEKQNLWPNCTYRHLIDNGECDKVNEKNADCNFDGEDCKWSSCPHKDWINDGVCDISTFILECNFDGDDCMTNTFNGTRARQNHLLWPNCIHPQRINDGKCDTLNNIKECNFDGQDCTTSNSSTPSPDLEDSTTPKSFDCSSCSRVKVYYESLTDKYNYKPSIFGHYKQTNQIINGHTYYESEHENQKYGIWMCSNKWHLEDAVHKGNCNAWAYNLDQKSCILDVDPTKWLLYEGFSSWKNANSNLKVKCSEWSLNL